MPADFDVDLEFSRLAREALVRIEAAVRAEQKGEAFRDLDGQ